MSGAKQNRVLVTGATGFLGSYVVEELLNNGYEVVAQGRNSELIEKFNEQGIETLQCGLDEFKNIELDVQFVIHCAGLSTIWGTWQQFYVSNVEGTKNVIEFCSRNNVKRLVFISSPSVYAAKHNRIDIKEDDVDLGNNLNLYIRSKIEAERVINDGRKSGLETVILRPRGIIGVGDPSIAPRLLKANRTFGIPLFNKGKNVIDLTCVENVALATRLAIESGQAMGNTYNITNDEPRDFRDLSDKLFISLGIAPRYKRRKVKILYFVAFVLELFYKILKISNEPPLTRYSICTLGYSQTLDISKAKEELGYQPKISLDEGIEKYGAHNRVDHN